MTCWEMYKNVVR